jgi:ketosteroid isomerase-like protein
MQARAGAGQAAMVVVAMMQAGCVSMTSDNRGDENAIRQADLEWSKAAAAKDVEKVVSYYAEDGAAYPPNAPVAAGKQAIKVAWTGMVNLPGFGISWAPSRVDVAKSGDLGWSTGTYNMTLNVPGMPANDHGKYVVVWKKQQPEGAWKAVADIFNSDVPAGAPPQAVPQQSHALSPPPPQ